MRGDGRGPEGRGPMTGRGLGKCLRDDESVYNGMGPGRAISRGPGRGLGRGRRGGPGGGPGRGFGNGNGFGHRGGSR